MIRLLNRNLCSIWSSFGFWCCVGVTFLLLLFSHIIINDDSITVFSAAFLFSREQLLETIDYSAFSVFCTYKNSCLFLFCSMLSIFPFVNLYTAQRTTGYSRYVLLRTTRRSFAVGQVLSLLITGVSAVFLGTLLFGLLVFVRFPHSQAYGDEMIHTQFELLQYQFPWINDAADVPKIVLLHLGCIILYTLCSTSFGIFMLALLRNRYLILTLPFFCCYLIRQLTTALISLAYQDIEHPNEMLYKITYCFRPEATLSLLYEKNVGAICWILLVHIGSLLGCCGLFGIIGNRRLDAGDF